MPGDMADSVNVVAFDRVCTTTWPSWSKSSVRIASSNGGSGEQDRPASEFQKSAELLDRLAARRVEACGRSDVDVRDEQSFFTVWLVAMQRPVGTDDRRSG